MMQPRSDEKTLRPAQSQSERPGKEDPMRPQPKSQGERYKPGNRLKGKKALITGGDSGIGRAVAVHFAKEGCDIAVLYLNEHEDAAETKRLVEAQGRICITLPGDVGSETFCRGAVDQAAAELEGLDIIVNNAAEQQPQESLEEISSQQLERCFRTNIFSCFHVSKAALRHLKQGASIINSASVTAYRGSAHLIDYAATKGAVVSFTRSLAQNLLKRRIRVNAVAPGPVWTPLIPSSNPPQKAAAFGSDAPMGRAAEPEEIAPCYVFLASEDASYITGQVIHPNGGEIING